jgi:hypothetical protein
VQNRVVNLGLIALICAYQKEVTKEMTLEERQKIAEEIRQHQYKLMNSMEVTNMETFNSFVEEMVPGDDEVWMGNPAMWLNMLTFYPNNEVINNA